MIPTKSLNNITYDHQISTAKHAIGMLTTWEMGKTPSHDMFRCRSIQSSNNCLLEIPSTIWLCPAILACPIHCLQQLTAREWAPSGEKGVLQRHSRSSWGSGRAEEGLRNSSSWFWVITREWNCIGELFQILVYIVIFFIDRFDFDDFKHLNGGVAKHLYVHSLERHIHGLWLDDIPQYATSELM